MPKKAFFCTLAVALIVAAFQVLTPATAQAQASCMHCNFAFAQCKRVGTMTPDQCQAQQATCVQECKAMNAGTTGAADKTKAADKDQKTKKN